MIDDDLHPPEASASTILLESVDDVSPLQYICDFEALLQHISIGNGSKYSIIAAIQRWWRDFMDGTGIGHYIVGLTRGFAQFDVYGVLCCMDAHYFARLMLMDLDFQHTSEMYRAHCEVIQESIQQTENIKNFMQKNKIDDEVVSIGRTKMLILCLLKKKEKIVKNWVKKGVLSNADMEELLKKSDHEMREALALQPSSARSLDPMDLLVDEFSRQKSSHVLHGEHSLRGTYT